MKKYYTEPEFEIRKYALANGSVLTGDQSGTSHPGDGTGEGGLDRDDEYDLFK